jgi:hypothetical protein
MFLVTFLPLSLLPLFSFPPSFPPSAFLLPPSFSPSFLLAFFETLYETQAILELAL